MSGLTDFDSSSEVFEIAQEFADDKVVVRLINKALAAGVRFAPDEVMALMLQIDNRLRFNQQIFSCQTWRCALNDSRSKRRGIHYSYCCEFA